MTEGCLELNYDIPANDFLHAGEASSSVKKMLNQLGVDPDKVKKTAISMYEAEINAVIHADGGAAHIEIWKDKVVIKICDKGPGIPNVELAMQEGYTTAPDHVRDMGFGAGMGLPNMKRYADSLDIDTAVGKGTTVTITVFLK
ncbi:MAG: ATP-binding protein [Bacillota bacterium]|nr:ATP-binding protein [Bacillota bacterium]